MSDLRSQLRAYGEQLEADQGLAGPSSGSDHRRASGGLSDPRRPASALALAAAMIAVLVTGLLLLNRPENQRLSVEPSTPTTAPSTATTTVTAVPATGNSSPTTILAVEPTASSFIGSWEGTDVDGSDRTMEIAVSSGEILRVTVSGDIARLCLEAGSTMTGVGRVGIDGALVVAAPEFTCDDGTAPQTLNPAIDERLREFSLFRESDTLYDNFGVMWSRPVTDGERAPTMVQPESSASVPRGWVAFPGNDGIYVVRGGVQPRRVDASGSDTRRETCPAFAPDGTRLLFGRATMEKIWISTQSGGDWEEGYLDGELVIVTVGDDGPTSQTQTIPLDGMDALPCPIWAPDGRWVAFGGDDAVWVVDTETGDTRRLTGYSPTDLEWRPGSDELTIIGEEWHGSQLSGGGPPVSDAPIYLYSVGADTTRTLGDVRATYLTWSPDGAAAAFRNGEPGSGDGIWLIDSDGQNLRQLSEGGERAVHGVDVVWSPSGDQIAFQRRNGCCEASDVVLVTATDTDPTNPIGTQRVIAAPVTASGEWSPFSVTWSPDGNHLLYVAWAWDGDNEVQGVIAVPIEGDEPPVVLAMGAVRKNRGTPSIPFQQWQPTATNRSN